MAGGALSFREDPFRLTPDRRYIFETDGFRRAFAMLLAGARARRGAMLLTGPSGTGKTTLLQGLLGKLQQDGAIVFWRFHPDIPGYDLIGSCLAELEIPDAPVDPIARAEALAKALKARAPSHPAVLIVDEAGQFADAQLAEIIALPAATDGAVQVVLAGLPAVAGRLDGDELFALKDAIALRAEIGPLNRGELGAYIAHRCRVAGQSNPLVFEQPAIGRVFDHTGGTPRLVNRLCATALFFAPADAKQISAAVVDEAARACAGERTAGEPQIPENAVPATAPSPVATSEPAAATTPAATSAPAATPPTEAPVKAPQSPAPHDAQSEVHRTLAEAERAWISGGVVKPEPVAAAAAEPVAAPAPAAAPAVEAAATAPIDLMTQAAETPADAAPIKAAASVRRRSPALRIAASVVVIAGSAAALMAVLWPTKIGQDYLVHSAPAKAVTRLLVANAPAATPVPEPARVVAEAAVPPEPTSPIIAKAEPIEVKPEPVVAALEPVETKPEPVAATPGPVAKPEPVAKQQRNAEKREAPKPGPVVATVEPAPEPPPVRVASAAPAIEVPASIAAPEPIPVAAVATQPELPAPPPPPETTVQIASPAPAPLASEPVAVAATLSAIAPANGPAAAAESAAKEIPVAAPTDAPKTEPAPVAIAAVEQKIETPAPAAKAPEAPALAVAAPPPPVPIAPRTAQAALPAADPTELRQLMARGDEMLKLGDPASARLFYERAAARGLARAYTAVGRTYDPLALQRLNIRGGGASGDQALDWYRRGTEAGDSDAAKAASDLTAWLARSR